MWFETQDPLLYTPLGLKGTLTGLQARLQEELPFTQGRNAKVRKGKVGRAITLILWQKLEVTLPSPQLHNFSDGGEIFIPP